MSRLNPASPLASLLAAPMRDGAVEWIGLRPERRTPMTAVAAANLRPGDGLEGDHYRGRPEAARQVTLVAAEDLAAIASFLGRERIGPELLRRNLVVRGINLSALQHRRLRVGSALLECTGACHPCSRMEEAFGTGGYNAVRGHGGITARVLEAGQVRVGDAVVALG